jgi:hypothetical protein
MLDLRAPGDILDCVLKGINQVSQRRLSCFACRVTAQPITSLAEYAGVAFDHEALIAAVIGAMCKVGVTLYKPSRILEQIH